MKRIQQYEEDAVYHCMSRSVHGERWLDEHGKAVFCKSLRKVAAFCGVRVITYCVMSNHFHLLVEVPARHLRDSISDAELVRRFRLLYGDQGTVYMPVTAERLESILAAGGGEARRWRADLIGRMNDLPMFMKLLKQRFTQWYNAQYQTFGTFWASRYTSLLVESDAEIMRKIACYIDLNPVRAGIVNDPAEYAWSGFGAASKGSAVMREGLASLCGWCTNADRIGVFFSDYTKELYQRGAFPGDKAGKGGFIPQEIVKRVLGERSPDPQIRPFATSFSNWIQRGYVLGRSEFIAKYCELVSAFLSRKRGVGVVTDADSRLECINGKLE